VLQERQLKAKRPGALYYRLPDLETLDRLTYRTLALGFPFLTTGLILGVLWAGRAWGSVFAYDPLALLSFVAWPIHAGTLAGRAPGRRLADGGREADVAPVHVQPGRGVRGSRRAGRGARRRVSPPLPLPGCQPRVGGAGPLHARGRRRRAPRLPGRRKPRLDDDRRAADPGPGEGRVCPRPGVRDDRAGAAHALHPSVRRRQEGPGR